MRNTLIALITLLFGIIDQASAVPIGEVSVQSSGNNLAITYHAVKAACQGDPSLILTDYLYKARRVGELSGSIFITFGDALAPSACHAVYETTTEGLATIYKDQIFVGQYRLFINGVFEGNLIVPLNGSIVFDGK